MITQERAYISPIWYTLKGQHASLTTKGTKVIKEKQSAAAWLLVNDHSWPTVEA